MCYAAAKWHTESRRCVKNSRITFWAMSSPADEWLLRNNTQEMRVRDSSVSHLILWGKLGPTTEVFDRRDGTWKRAIELPQLALVFRASDRLRDRDRVAEAIVAFSRYLALAGLLVLGFQLYVYLRHGEWPAASLYQVATCTLPEITSSAIAMPGLSALLPLDNVLPPVARLKQNPEIIARWRRWYQHTALTNGVRPAGWQISLVLPQSWYGAHRVLVSLLKNISITGAFFIAAFLIFLLGASLSSSPEQWKALDEIAELDFLHQPAA